MNEKMTMLKGGCDRRQFSGVEIASSAGHCE